MRSPSVGLCLFGLSALLAPAVAPCQTPPDRARECFELGLAALQGGRMHDSAALFEESYALHPFPVVLYNLGLAWRGEGRNADAVGAFERYLRDPSPDDSAALLDTIRSEVARLRSLLAVVRVTVRPESAAVTLDGRPVTRPLDDLLVSPERHVLAAQAEGYNMAQIALALAPGQSYAHQLRLDPWARLVVNTPVAGVTVHVDGRPLTDPRAVLLPPGTHRLEVRAPGYELWQRSVVLGRTGVVPVSVELFRVPRRIPGWVAPVVITSAAAVALGVIAWVLVSSAPSPVYSARLGTVSL